MTFRVSEITSSDFASTVTVSPEKGAEMMFMQYADGRVSACSKNASHRAWGGLGKTFTDWDAVRAHYKSAKAQAMIEIAEEQLAS